MYLDNTINVEFSKKKNRWFASIYLSHENNTSNSNL